MTDPVVWFEDCSSLRFVRTGWVLAPWRSGPVRRSLGPGQRLVGFFVDGAIGPLYCGRWYRRQVLFTCNGDAALDYLPSEAVAPAALARAA